MFFPQACLFDLDGLLLDTEELHGQAWALTASNFGMNLTQSQLMLLRGQRRIDCATQIGAWLSKEVAINELIDVHDPISKHLISQAKAMPGAENLVRWCCDKGIPIALVTSSSSKSVAFKSTPHPWLKMIQTRVLGDDSALKKGKPAPDPFVLAAKKLEVDPKLCWAFEDSQSGIESALAAGCQVWVLNNDSNMLGFPEQTGSSNPRHIKHLDIVLKELKML